MKLFQGQDILELAERFNSNESCIEYLAHFKWKEYPPDQIHLAYPFDLAEFC